jgi:DNA polymerase-1
VIVNILDVSGFIYRAYYGLPKMNSDGGAVGALFGFCKSMMYIVSLFPKSMFISAFDSSRKTFRNEIYNEYKANRSEMPEDLVQQIEYIREASEMFVFVNVSKRGFEADDIIASYVNKLKGGHFEINIISSDKDLLQLISPPQVKIFDPMKKRYITEDDIAEKFGVEASRIVDFIALVGDSSDNIPGVSGIGKQTAAELISRFGSLESILENLDQLPLNKKYNTLRAETEKAKLSKELAILKTDLDLPFEYTVQNFKNLRDLFQKFKFNSLLEKINAYN